MHLTEIRSRSVTSLSVYFRFFRQGPFLKVVITCSLSEFDDQFWRLFPFGDSVATGTRIALRSSKTFPSGPGTTKIPAVVNVVVCATHEHVEMAVAPRGRIWT